MSTQEQIGIVRVVTLRMQTKRNFVWIVVREKMVRKPYSWSMKMLSPKRRQKMSLQNNREMGTNF